MVAFVFALHRRDAVALGVLTAIGVGVPLWLAAASGSLGLPSNDDWVYMRGAESLYRTGVIDMPGHTAASIGQLILVQPMLWLSHGRAWAFPAFALLMTLIGITATFLLARRFVTTAAAIVVVLLIEVFPGFARESASFMTDCPAFALTTVSLLLGTMWLDGGDLRALVSSIGVGLLATSIREFAIAAPIGILAVTWVRSGREDRRSLTVITASFVAAVGLILTVAASIPGKGLATAQAGAAPLILVGFEFTTLAAGLLPAIVLRLNARERRASMRYFLPASALVLLVLLAFSGPLIGNLWARDGALGNGLLSGERDPVIPSLVWRVSEQLASFAAISLAAIMFAAGSSALAYSRSVRSVFAAATHVAHRRDAVLLFFLVATAGEIVGFAAVGGGTLDRYLYAVIPTAGIVLLRGEDHMPAFGPRAAFAHAGFAWLAISAALIAANSFAFDAARFREGEAAVRMGYAAAEIDAGYDWVGFHATNVGPTSRVVEAGAAPFTLSWYYGLIPATPPCAVLSNSPLSDPGVRLARVDPSSYRQYLFVGPAEPLYLYALVRDGCPKPPVVGLQDQP